MAYPPIQEHGIVGNMRTVALIATNGTIDWLCFPHFDSPSLFGALLDDEKGGYFRIAPVCEGLVTKQFYWPETNILVTRFMSEDGVGEMQDFMPAGMAHAPQWHEQLVRRIRLVRGTMKFRVECFPAFDYARAKHVTRITEHGATFEGPALTIGLTSEVPLRKRRNGVTAEFELREGETVSFVLREVEGGGHCGERPKTPKVQELFEATVDFWHKWLAQCTYTGRWREAVHRSALALKLLTFEPTGAIVAAPTCSLPEYPGGHRNWDYRFTWIRDAAFTIYAFMRIGFTSEARNFMKFLEARCREAKDGEAPLQIVYGIDGRHDLTEIELDHLSGYEGAKPVRIGNGAFDQRQLDIYGELMDAAYLYNKYGEPISYELWTHLRRLVDWVCDNWRRADRGIWEKRGKSRHFVYSKLMCWVALDRGLRLADKRSLPADRAKWQKARDEIYARILRKGWSKERNAFVQSYGSTELDASNLIMPLVFFMSPTDPRMLATIDETTKHRSDGGLLSDSLVFRYDAEQDRSEPEGTFNMCTFWLVEALTRAGKSDPKRLTQARIVFERMLGYANHLGLYSEQTGSSGQALGNFPQAFTHLALISAAFGLNRVLDNE